jgi:hypothetical protein
MKKKIPFIILTLIMIATLSTTGGVATPLQPDRITQIAQLLGEEYNGEFGYAVAFSGDTLAVGDPYDNQNGDESGSVTIIQSESYGHWNKVTRLMPSDAEAGIRFGTDVAISGDRAVVGAPFDNDFGENSGSIYIFERDQGGDNAWGQVAKLTASDAYTNDQYGWAVAVDGDTVVAGAYTKTYGGRVYIYERDAGGPGQWGETAQLNPDPPGFQACFGESLDLDRRLLAVGAYGGGDYAGYVYVFQHLEQTGQWQRLTRFRAADTYAYHYFGFSVALDDWTILAGAPGVEGLAGAAYIFSADPAQPDVWTEQARLVASDGAYGDYLGLELDLSGAIALVGAPAHENASGAVYIYSRDEGGPDSWGEVTHLQGSDSLPGDQFGNGTAIQGYLALAGSPGSALHGSVYLFDLNPPWINHLPLVTRE